MTLSSIIHNSEHQYYIISILTVLTAHYNEISQKVNKYFIEIFTISCYDGEKQEGSTRAMYVYTFTLTPSRNKSDIIFSDIKDLFSRAVDNINSNIAFSRDKKTIRIPENEIKEKSLIVTLESVSPLANPARSLSSLTRYLTTYHRDFFAPYVYNKTLFNIHLDSQSCSMSLKNDEMTNEELLKAIIDLLYTQPNSDEKATAIDNLKNVVKPFMRPAVGQSTS